MLILDNYARVKSGSNSFRGDECIADARRLEDKTEVGSWQVPVLWATATVVLLFTWLPRVFRSFWVDEAGSFLMAHQGPLAAIRFTSHWPGQSMLYAAVASLFASDHGPLREFWFRVPSLAGVLLAAFLLALLAERAIGKGAGFLAAVLFIFHPAVINLGTQARPYSLALAAVSGSCLALFLWVETRRPRCLVGYVVAAALVTGLHYFFTVIFLCHALYLAYVFLVEGRTSRWQHLLAGYACLAGLVSPLYPHIRLLLHEAHTLPFTAAPSPGELFEALAPSTLTWGLLAAGFLTQWWFPQSFRKPQPLSRSFGCLLFSWWIAAPLILFVLSVATPMRVFLPRYIASSVPGQVLILAYAGYSIFKNVPGRYWALGAILLSSASPLAMLAARKTGSEELKPFLTTIAKHSRVGTPPVFFSSPLPESNFYNWRQGLANGSYLYAPFVAYPIPNRLLPLPFTLDTDEIRTHIDHVINTQLSQEPEVLFVSHSFAGQEAWNRWLIERMAQAGFSVTSESVNLYSVLIFDRSPENASKASAKRPGQG